MDRIGFVCLFSLLSVSLMAAPVHKKAKTPLPKAKKMRKVKTPTTYEMYGEEGRFKGFASIGAVPRLAMD